MDARRIFTLALACVVWMASFSARAAQDPKSVPQKPPRIEAVFVLDTTGSMSGLIAAAKEKIWSIGNTLSSADPAPEIKMGLLGYRDRGDVYITRSFALTDDIDDMYTHLMEFQAGGGGDGPESVNQALYEAVEKGGWSADKDVYRVVFLVGDYPPHMDYQNDIKYMQTCELAREKGVTINTVLCGNNPEAKKIWKDIAQRGGGEFFQVAQSGNAALYDTPYDARIAEASRRLDRTKLYYGDREDRDRARKKMEKSSSIYRGAKSSAVAQRALFNSDVSGKKNFLGSKELVDEVSEGKVAMESIPEAELPAPLQAMEPEKRKEKIRDLKAERDRISAEIKELGKKRQAFIEEKVRKEKAGKGETLEGLVYESVKKQARDKGIAITGGPKY